VASSAFADGDVEVRQVFTEENVSPLRFGRVKGRAQKMRPAFFVFMGCFEDES
jgi:hypothetical protein